MRQLDYKGSDAGDESEMMPADGFVAEYELRGKVSQVPLVMWAVVVRRKIGESGVMRVIVGMVLATESGGLGCACDIQGFTGYARISVASWESAWMFATPKARDATYKETK